MHIPPTLRRHPRRMLLLDGAGALVSAFLSGVVLVRWHARVGIPPAVLYLLAAVALGLAAFDGCCYLSRRIRLPRALRTIAVLNVAYCALSLVLAAMHRDQLLPLAYGYLGLECIIVGWLARTEWKLASGLR